MRSFWWTRALLTADSSAAARWIARAGLGALDVAHRHVVVDEQRLHVDAVGEAHLLRHVEGNAVAGVVVDQQQHAFRRREELRRLVDVVHRRGGEHVARAGSVEHALADDHHVGRLVPRPGTLDDRHFVVARGIGAIDQVVFGHVRERVRVGVLDARVRFELVYGTARP